MNRTAKAARTPHDKDNVNRLRVPEFGVKKLIVKAGAKASKSYQPQGAKYAPDENGGADDFHFAPEQEVVDIVYELVDAFGAIDGATLALHCRFQEAPLWTLDLKALGHTWWLEGKHTVKWDGRVINAAGEQAGTFKDGGFEHDLTQIAAAAAPGPFPHGYVNLEHTTYKLKLTVTAGELVGDPAVAWTYFHILAEKLELEYADEKVLPIPVAGGVNHRRVRASLILQGARPPAPAAAAPVKVFLESNVYKRGAAQMMDNTLYTQYETMWGDGPEIALLAKVTILSSEDKGVDAPKALGNVKFLWDWESKGAALATGRHADVFVNNAQNYDTGTTNPKGQNCHLDRGGKRGTGAKAVFPARPGYAPADDLVDGSFPFKVEAVTGKRTWAAYSYGWGEKALAGKTGVIFQPSRMAGDAYAVSVYLAWDVDATGKNLLDVDDDVLNVPKPERVKASTGTFQVWRRTHLRKQLKKRAAGIPALSPATIGACYSDAFMELEDASGVAQAMLEADWNNGVTGAIAAWSDEDKLLIDPAVNQHTAGPEGVHFRTRAQFTEELKKKRIKDALTANGTPDADATAIGDAAGVERRARAAARTARATARGLGYGDVERRAIGRQARAAWTATDTWMNNPVNGMDTLPKYATVLQGKAIGILEALFDGQFDADDGVTIFQTERSHNLTGHQAGITIGLAYDFPSVSPAAGNPSRCGFLLMAKAGDVPCGLDKISGHEIGHHYFLPHPRDTAERRDYKAHDQITPSQCLMSYNFAQSMTICGLCQLRLRGWDKSKIDPDGTKNKKP